MKRSACSVARPLAVEWWWDDLSGDELSTFIRTCSIRWSTCLCYSEEKGKGLSENEGKRYFFINERFQFLKCSSTKVVDQPVTLLNGCRWIEYLPYGVVCRLVMTIGLLNWKVERHTFPPRSEIWSYPEVYLATHGLVGVCLRVVVTIRNIRFCNTKRAFPIQL